MELLCNGRPAEPGEMAELFVTTLDKGCIPHIRYRTGDVYRFISTQCLCGHNFPVVKLEGRLRNFLFREGQITLTPRALDKIVGNPRWMDLYKIIQTDDTDFLFNFISNDTYEENKEEYIRKELSRALGQDIDLKVERAEYIPTERSGKFLSCVSKVGEKNVENGFSL